MRATDSQTKMPSFALFLDLVGYRRAWDLQKRLHASVARGLLPNLLLLMEHPHVYTQGRRGKASDVLISDERLAEIGAEVHYIDRGGEATYHGPGQLVGYPILKLRGNVDGPLDYVQRLAWTLEATLAELGVRGESEGRPTGVWVGEAKIAAIGVKISRGATMHGFALNVDPDLSYFDNIVPCGMPDGTVTSISRETAQEVRTGHVAQVLARQFGRVFGWQMEWTDLEGLGRLTGDPEVSFAAGR